MKIFALLLLLGCMQAFAADSTPYSPELYAELSRLGKDRVVTSSFRAATTYASGDTVNMKTFIPPKSLITDVEVFVKTAIVSSNDNTISFGCASEDNLKAARDYTDDVAGDTFDGALTGALAEDMIYTASGCAVSATIGSGSSGIESGELWLDIHYRQRKYP